MAADSQTKTADMGCESANINGIYHSTSTIAISYYAQPKADTEGGRLSRPRHCTKGAQPVPKAVHCSGCRDKHNCLWPLTPQSIMPSLNHCDLLRHMVVNNLNKVVTRQCHGRELNSEPLSCKSNALTTRLLSHLMASQQFVKVSNIARNQPITTHHSRQVSQRSNSQRDLPATTTAELQTLAANSTQ